MEFPEKLTFEDFEKMHSLEKKFYEEEFITPSEEAYEWYKKYPYTVTVAKDGDKIAGFVNLFPVKKHIFELIKAGKFNDSEMTAEDIEDKECKEMLNMFLCCAVIDEEYRRDGLTAKLLRAASKQYEGCICGEIVADNVTEDGYAFSEKYGFDFVCNSDHDSKIYIQKYSSFVEKIK